MDTMTDAEWAVALEQMRRAGTDAGKAAGGWIADGNTKTAHLETLLRQWEEGDPAAPSAPSPFSGEWANDPTVRDIVERESIADPDSLTPEEEDELATAFEDAYEEAWQDEAERTVRAFLGK